MKKYEFVPTGVCSRKITFSIEDGKIYDLKFDGGCNGNLKAIGKLLEGAEVKFAIERLKGNTCGMRSTSCADQLTRALEKSLED